VLVETSHGRTQAGFSVPANATPVDVSLMLREKGWTAYRIRFDHSAFVWVATVIAIRLATKRRKLGIRRAA
jgi:hypothetical protein